jgi:hypothetical protein
LRADTAPPDRPSAARPGQAAWVRRQDFAQQPIIAQRRSAASFASVRYARDVRDPLESVGHERREQLALGRDLPAVAGAGP